MWFKYMPKIADNLTQVRRLVQQTASAAGRNPSDITLLAVSKTKSIQDIEEAFAAGQCLFGENYAQEVLEKSTALAHLPIEWHFIGPIQSNKTRIIAESCDWAHTIDRLKIAERLNAQRPSNKPPLHVCIQVNIDGDSAKSGCLPQDVLPLAQALQQLPHLKLRGLMTIPREDSGRKPFDDLAQLSRDLVSKGVLLDTLSMGMSGDLEDAVAAGSTLVRIGSAIFGARAYSA
jgi:pyridoxal phosphate enzyme (YggS family)